MKNSIKKTTAALALALTFLVGLFPGAALAADDTAIIRVINSQLRADHIFNAHQLQR